MFLPGSAPVSHGAHADSASVWTGGAADPARVRPFWEESLPFLYCLLNVRPDCARYVASDRVHVTVLATGLKPSDW